MHKFIDLIAGLFIGIVVAFAGVAILAIWDILSEDVIYKSMMSVGILGAVLFLVMVASNFLDKNEQATVLQNHTFAAVRRQASITLSLSVIFFAIVALMGVWEVVESRYLSDVYATLSVVAGASIVILVVALKRENNPYFINKNISGGWILIGLIALWIFFSAVGL